MTSSPVVLGLAFFAGAAVLLLEALAVLSMLGGGLVILLNVIILVLVLVDFDFVINFVAVIIIILILIIVLVIGFILVVVLSAGQTTDIVNKINKTTNKTLYLPIVPDVNCSDGP
jgi:hypothetical protein